MTIFPLQTSNGTVDFKENSGPQNSSVLEATLVIINGTTFTAKALIDTLDDGLVSGVTFIGRQEPAFEPQSFTMIYKHNSKESKNRKISIGKRQPGDKLLKFERKRAGITNRFAETEFKFPRDTSKSLTYVGFTFDVSPI